MHLPNHSVRALDLYDGLIQGFAEVEYTSEITYTHCGHEEYLKKGA